MPDSKSCEVCQSATRHPLARLCKRCKKIAERVDPRHTPKKDARILALRKSWDGEGFRCYYSGVRLVDDDSGSPRYITLDHRTPGNEDDIVIAASVINDMKTNMDEEGFRKIVVRLAEHFSGGPPLGEDTLDKIPRRKR